jgi:hypothetical protein
MTRFYKQFIALIFVAIFTAACGSAAHAAVADPTGGNLHLAVGCAYKPITN